MPADYYPTPDRLLLEVFRICGGVCVSIHARPYLHPEEFKVIPDHPLYIGLCMNMPLNGGLEVVLCFRSCRTSFAVDVLNPVVFNPFNPIPRSTQNFVVVLYPFPRDGRRERLSHDESIVIPDNYIGHREDFRPIRYVLNGLFEFVPSAHAVWIGLVIAGVMVIDYVPDKNYLVTVVSFVGFQQKSRYPSSSKGQCKSPTTRILRSFF